MGNSSSPICTRCGTPIPAGATDQLCPACLMSGALARPGGDETISAVPGQFLGQFVSSPIVGPVGIQYAGAAGKTLGKGSRHAIAGMFACYQHAPCSIGPIGVLESSHQDCAKELSSSKQRAVRQAGAQVSIRRLEL